MKSLKDVNHSTYVCVVIKTAGKSESSLHVDLLFEDHLDRDKARLIVSEQAGEWVGGTHIYI